MPKCLGTIRGIGVAGRRKKKKNKEISCECQRGKIDLKKNPQHPGQKRSSLAGGRKMEKEDGGGACPKNHWVDLKRRRKQSVSEKGKRSAATAEEHKQRCTS